MEDKKYNEMKPWKQIALVMGVSVLLSPILHKLYNPTSEYKDFREKKKELRASYTAEASSLIGNFEDGMTELDDTYQTNLKGLKLEKKIKKAERKLARLD